MWNFLTNGLHYKLSYCCQFIQDTDNDACWFQCFTVDNVRIYTEGGFVEIYILSAFRC